MSCKVPGSHNAVGYWGRNINTRIEQEQIPSKIEALLQDKLLSRGKQVYLWTEVTIDTPNTIECSCVKDTTNRADVTCNSCYGVKLVPGYNKFLHNTLYISSSSSNITLIDTEIDTVIKPNKIVLAQNKLSGSITSHALHYNNVYNGEWEFKLDAPNILNNNIIAASFSTDGVNFYPLENINDDNIKPVGVGIIYLRISMSRNDVNDRSPEFEILRIRCKNNTSPYILILRPQYSEIPSLVQYGRRLENLGERFWTMPLNFFDSTIPANTKLAKILDNAFYERVGGINSGARFTVTKTMYNEEFGRFTHQSFEPRRVQKEEVYSALVF